MPPGSEVLGDGPIGGEKALGVPGRFEPLHAPLALSGGLMGVLRAVIEVFVLAVFHAREDLSLRGAIAFEFVGDDDPRHVR